MWSWRLEKSWRWGEGRRRVARCTRQVRQRGRRVATPLVGSEQNCAALHRDIKTEAPCDHLLNSLLAANFELANRSEPAKLELKL